MAGVAKVLFSGKNRYIINVTGAYSAADETDTVIVDLSTLTGPDGTAATKLKINEVTWAVGAGFDYVLLEWDATTDQVIDYFQGQGYMDYRLFGGKIPDSTAGGYTGDLILTTSGGAAGDTYSFLIDCTLKD